MPGGMCGICTQCSFLCDVVDSTQAFDRLLMRFSPLASHMASLEVKMSMHDMNFVDLWRGTDERSIRTAYWRAQRDGSAENREKGLQYVLSTIANRPHSPEAMTMNIVSKADTSMGGCWYPFHRCDATRMFHVLRLVHSRLVSLEITWQRPRVNSRRHVYSSMGYFANGALLEIVKHPSLRHLGLIDVPFEEVALQNNNEERARNIAKLSEAVTQNVSITSLAYTYKGDRNLAYANDSLAQLVKLRCLKKLQITNTTIDGHVCDSQCMSVIGGLKTLTHLKIGSVVEFSGRLLMVQQMQPAHALVELYLETHALDEQWMTAFTPFVSRTKQLLVFHLWFDHVCVAGVSALVSAVASNESVTDFAFFARHLDNKTPDSTEAVMQLLLKLVLTNPVIASLDVKLFCNEEAHQHRTRYSSVFHAMEFAALLNQVGRQAPAKIDLSFQVFADDTTSYGLLKKEVHPVAALVRVVENVYFSHRALETAAVYWILRQSLSLLPTVMAPDSKSVTKHRRLLPP